MPFETKLVGSIIRTDLSGEVSTRELVRVAAEVARLEQANPNVRGRLGDVRAVTATQVDFAVMDAFVRQRKAAVLPHPVRSAVVAQSPLQYGFARMFQTLNDHPQIEIRIFDDEAKAIAWISAEEDGKAG